jgi:hypothetical protein
VPFGRVGVEIIWGSGFWGFDSGFRVQGTGFQIQGVEFRVQGSGCGDQGSGFRVWGLNATLDR